MDESYAMHHMYQFVARNVLCKSLDRIRHYEPELFAVIQSNPDYFGIENTYVPIGDDKISIVNYSHIVINQKK